MAEYLLVESQGPWAGPGCRKLLWDTLALADLGHDVWLFLVDDGATTALDRADAPLADVLGAGVRVWVDEFSVRRRCLAETSLAAGVELVGIEKLAGKLLEAGLRVVWH